MKQTVTSKYEPKSKNVTWIDMSTGSPVQKNFINGMWRSTGGSGGGSGSSNPTKADATKVWQVTPVQKGTKTEGTVIVPEQTLVDGQDLEYNDKFVLGAQCVAVVNGVEYRGEVVKDKEDSYIFEAEFGGFVYNRGMGVFQFYKNTEPEVTAKLSVIEEVPDYDYNWAPGVKIPIPTAEDEGKILVVTKVAGDNTSTIAPEQEVPADNVTPLTNVDLTKFVIGNTVKVTITYEEQGGEIGRGDTRGAELANSQTFTATGVIVEQHSIPGVIFDIQELDSTFYIAKRENSLATNAFQLGLSNATIKLEYIESNYEYQLQENSGPSNMVIEATPMTQEEINLVTTPKGYITGGYKVSINQLPVHIKIKYEDSENEYIYTTQCILNDSNNDLYGIITETSLGDFRTIYFLVPNNYTSGDLVTYDSSALPEGFMYYIMLQ